MSDVNNQEDLVDIPEGEAPSVANQAAKRGMSPGLKLGLLVGGVFTILGGSFFLSTSSGSGPESAMRSAPTLDATPGGTNQAENPRFQELLQQANDQRAADAASRGQTFIPVPEGQLQPLDRFEVADAGEAPAEEPKPAEAPQVVAPPSQPTTARLIEQRSIPAPGGTTGRSGPVTTAPARQQQNPYIQGMVQQMGSISQGQGRGSSMLVVDQPAPDIGNSTQTAEADGASSAADPAQAQTTIISAGTILYGETLTSSSSDLPGPVLVEVTTGPFKGGRLVGAFATAEAVDRMVVEFKSMTLPDGTSVSVSAYAVDGVSAETAVASDVNRRYMQRYAPILAAAFITGYSKSAAQPSQELVDLGNGNSVVTGTTTAEQNLYAGLAAAGEAVGTDLIRNAPKGPEVILRSGWPIGIMFVEPVLQDQN